MKKLIVISLFAIFSIALFVNAEQPQRAVSDTIVTNTDTTRVDTVPQKTIKLNHTIHNNIKGN